VKYSFARDYRFVAVDKSAIVWEASTGAARQQYNFHSAPILDVDWATPSIFATASTDKSIQVWNSATVPVPMLSVLLQVCSLGERTAVRSWVGHTDEVNGISWSPNKGAGGKRDNLLLASCSDDGTARLWNLGNMDRLADKSDRDTGSVATFTGHRKAVYSIKWAPAGEGSANPSKPPVIGT
jgi:transducin (beta)-like 1